MIKISTIYQITIFAGYISFFLNVKSFNSILALSFLFLVFFGYLEFKTRRPHLKLLLPFSSGLFCFLMRQFYWDQVDFINRVNNLILLSFLFSLILVARKFNIFKKFLFYFNRLPVKKRLITIFIFTEILLIISSYTIVKKGVVLVGDEPHYLVISQSIAQDFDLNVFNQYFRDKFKSFIEVEKLPPHGTFGKGHKKMYSFHFPGVSITLVPFLFLKLPLSLFYFLIRSYLALFGAMLAVVIYMISLKLWKNPSLSIFITIVFTMTAPIFFYSIHIYPELQAILLILSSLYLLLFSEKKRNLKILIAGFLLSITIFWGVKYVIFIYLYTLGFFIFFIRKKEFKKALLFILFPLIFQMLFFYYLYSAYGNLSFNSVYYGIMTETQKKDFYQMVFERVPFRMRLETFLDYFFDQRDGLLLYNPFYFFAFPGLFFAFKKFKTHIPHLLISSAGFIFIANHAFSTIRPGFSPQARYVVPVIWMLMLFSVIYYRESKNRLFKRIFLTIPLYSIFVVIYQIISPFTLYQSTTHKNLVRPGLMFQQWSNMELSLSRFLPSFAKLNNANYLPNYIFIGFLIVLIVLSIVKMKKTHRHFFFVTGFFVFFLIFSLFPRPPFYNHTRITKGGTIPHAIYGVSFYPTQRPERKFNCSEPGRRFLISTRRPADQFIFEFESLFKKGKVDIEIYHFDRLVKTVRLDPGIDKKISAEVLNFKKQKYRYIFQFHLKIKATEDSQSPLFILQLYPTRHVD